MILIRLVTRSQSRKFGRHLFIEAELLRPAGLHERFDPGSPEEISLPEVRPLSRIPRKSPRI